MERRKPKIGAASRTKKKARRAVYQTKYNTERKRFRNFMQRVNQKCEVPKIAKRMVNANQDIIGEQCIRNDDGVLRVSN